MSDWKSKLQGIQVVNPGPTPATSIAQKKPETQYQKPHSTQSANAGHGNRQQRHGQGGNDRQDHGNRELRENRQPTAGGGNANANLFHNPYHFVPTLSDARVDDRKKDDFKEGKVPYLTHDHYLTGDRFYSGRIICRMETKTPIFIGGKHEDGSRTIPPFEITPDIPAIPASSLRGLISSIAEAASNSAMRVLENRPFTRRLGMREALKAIGIMEKDKTTGKLMLRPLVMPSLKCDATGGSAKLEEYAGIFTKPALRVYLDGYRRKPGSNPPELEKTPGLFLATKNPKSYSSDNKEFWYMQLGTSSLGIGSNPVMTCSNPRIKTISGRNGDSYFLNGQKPFATINTKPEIIDQTTYDTLNTTEQKAYTKGILRVLGLGLNDCRAKDIPEGRKHEIFIPYDPASPPGKLLDVAMALDTFHKLAKTRTELDQTTPFEVEGSVRNSSGAGDIELREGDMVFFDIQNGGKTVKELAISSIWRRWINGSCHDFFSKISNELLPFNSKREVITIAEQMFGFVSEQEKGAGEESLAFKSRIRFSNGLLHNPGDACYLPEVTLKILDSPKPPSPNMYFRRTDRDGRPVYIPKTGNDVLSCSRGDCPQGRKIYLHHPDATANQPWKTAPGQENVHADQKSKITPIKDSLSFYFHIDFDNLTNKELSLLCYALAPNANYMHKIGMGKPIGLGSVKIHTEGIFLINRAARYSADGFSAARYHRSWTNGNHEKWPDEDYDEEKKCVLCGSLQPIEQLASEFPVEPSVKRAIDLLGAMPSNKVHYPQIQGVDSEDKLFQWFIANDTGSGRGGNKIPAQEEVLGSITENSSELPSLKRYPWNG